MKNLIVLFSTCFLMHSCGYQYRTHEFDTTIKVTNTDGKSVKDISVSVTTCTYCNTDPSSSSSKKVKFGSTDSEGLVKLNYVVEDSESSTDFAHIKIEDNASILAISKATHSVGSERGKQKYTKSYSFLIDSVRTYKLRVQKTAATVSMINFSVAKIYYTNGSYSTDSVSRQFLSWSNTRAAFDSTFTFTAYAKMPFDIGFGLGSTSMKVQPKLVGRDSIFLIKF